MALSKVSYYYGNTKEIKISKLIKITPTNKQLAHIAKCLEILEDNYNVLDRSLPGAGKTYIHRYIAQELGLYPIVVGNGGSIQSWKKLDDNFGRYTLDWMTYNTLCGSKGKEYKCKYLDCITDAEGNKTYVPTDFLMKRIELGCYFIFDEAHFAKNDTSTYHAVCAIVRAILDKNECYSRFAFLTATPATNVKQMINILHAYGCYKDKLSVYDREEQISDHTGLEQFIKYARRFNKEAVDEYVKENPYSGFNNISLSRDYVLDLFELIAPGMSSSLAGIKYEYNLHCGRGFYTLDAPSMHKLNTNLEKLKEQLKIDKKDEKEANIGIKHQTILENIENAKLNIFQNIVSHAVLNNKRKSKFRRFIIFLNYLQNEKELAEKFDMLNAEHGSEIFKHRTVNGGTSIKKRDEYINLFQDGQINILICTLNLIGQSYSLHDLKGDQGTLSLVSPNYRPDIMFQSANRSYRQNLKSHCVMRLVFAKADTGVNLESKLVDKLIEKSKVLQRTSANGGLFPGSYSETGDSYDEPCEKYDELCKAGINENYDEDVELDEETKSEEEDE